jgi:MarR family transcriptional regulator, organic hydroperoxide resistance regulator
VNWCPGGDRLDQDIFDAMTEFMTQLMQRGERLAERFDVPVSCMKALRRLDVPVTMKDLGQRLRCDPSFVTMIADALEQRGLAKREASVTDRRIKNLVLTPQGLELKASLEQETLCVMPWADALTEEEREQFLGLVRKMNVTLAEQDGPAASSDKSHAVKVKNTAAAAAVAAVLEEVTSSTTSAAG